MKVCFVGIGSIAKRHICNLSQICRAKDIPLQIDALRRVGSKQLDCEDLIRDVYTSVNELPCDYDVIFLTNPTEYHADMLIRLHDHARNFFIEKPVASLSTVSKLQNFMFREDAVYYVACPLRYHRVIQYLKENVNPAEVNSVRSISSSYLPEWRPGTDYRETYSAHRELGGGVGIDLIHEWDYLTYLFGMPQEVCSFSGRVSSLEIDSDDYAIYIARYDSMIAELHLDYFGRKTVRKIEIFTDEDTIVGDIAAGRVTYLCSGKSIELPEDRDTFQKKELLYFLELLNKNAYSESNVAHAIQVLKLTQGSID